MENIEKQKYESLKEIVAGLQNALELYNQLNPEEMMELTKKDTRKDVSNIFICVYNDKHVGLFEKINWNTTPIKKSKYSDIEYDAGSIYVGVNSNYIGMKTTHHGSLPQSHWEPAGTYATIDEVQYVANCTMKNGMSFDDMRLIMYNNGEIGSYEVGKATDQEILEVLKYASSYYQLSQSFQKKI